MAQPGATPPAGFVNRLRDPSALIALGLILVALVALRHTVSSTSWLLFAVAIPSIVLHEISHGATAFAFGDDTARRAGRLSLNPARHVDPVGTLVLPAVLALSGVGVFGYAKPVPVNPSRMRNPRDHGLLVSLAGPACNLLLASAAVVVLREALHPSPYVDFGAWPLGERIVFLFGFVNVTLAVFNALPVPPLDGSAVVARLLPARVLPRWYSMTRYAMPALLVVLLIDSGRLLSHVFDPALQAYSRLVLS
jgi:Zn-dependent protease